GGQAQQGAEHVGVDAGRVGQGVAECVLDQVLDGVAVVEAGGDVAGEGADVAAEQLVERVPVAGVQPQGQGDVVGADAAALCGGGAHDGVPSFGDGEPGHGLTPCPGCAGLRGVAGQR